MSVLAAEPKRRRYKPTKVRVLHRGVAAGRWHVLNNANSNLYDPTREAFEESGIASS